MPLSYPEVSRKVPASMAIWPDGVRCLVAYTVDFDGMGNEVGKGLLPYGAHSAGRYSARRGIPRHLDMLERLGIPATFFVPGYDAECYPQTIRDIAAAGHEIGAHGYVHEGTLLPPEEERRRLALTHGILAGLTGKPPVGWRSPSGQKTVVTLPVLHELGYLYDSSDKDADTPYTIKLAGGKSLVEIPNNTYSLDDFPFYNFSMTPVSEVAAQWKEEFDARFALGGFFMLTVHPRAGWGSGTPSRVKAIEDVLRHVKQHEGIRFANLGTVQQIVASHPMSFDEVLV
ncbi:MAG TPA: polysaccharide deacetylase family protein [Ramlibacter sp.]|nr:polysaccharide deacetylase family protein [Ramlibacter sp.]